MGNGEREIENVVPNSSQAGGGVSTFYSGSGAGESGVSAASSARSGHTDIFACGSALSTRHLVSLHPPSKHTLSIVLPLVLRQVSCRSLTERGFQKSAKLQRKNISWKACGGAQASKPPGGGRRKGSVGL